MALVDRLILREILVPLAVGILAIVQLLVILQLLQLNQIVFGSAVTLGDLGRLTVALAPPFLVVALPNRVGQAAELPVGLGGGLLAEPAALVEAGHLEAGRAQPPGDRRPGGAGADDQDVGIGVVGHERRFYSRGRLLTGRLR